MLREHCADNTASFVLGQATYVGIRAGLVNREFINCTYGNRIWYFE
ncbi:MAG: hypothetical protein C5S48_08255 [Candidatus Methanogaster sp.]|nr:MAG: hypothetical protein C5S48_08255 [ANME-2 cluster archaeon]